jgi:EAL domain-containing protein (putative c-di-GMP-specific phosphodiesterase class I)
VLSAADIACYAAKDAGRNRVHVHDPGAVSGRHREMYWVSRLTRAVDAGRLELHGQPIVAIAGAPAPAPAPQFLELLVRLRDEDGALVLPGEFIPAAERYNMVGAIDRWVVEQAVARLRAQQAAGGALPLLAVNVSANSLTDRDFLDFLLPLVGDPAIGRGLCFDIAESALLTSTQQVVNFMREVRQRGCRIALDDFGTGLSAFHYLKKYPVDFLKIDGQLLGDPATDLVDRSMVEAICKVAATLGIATIAERVESAAALEHLRSLGVGFAQGFQLARPEPLGPVAGLSSAADNAADNAAS